ncbi:hypothetical protein CWB41_13975 [Methylovirgula ligni]|uniref:Uncharacterized protein n=1 Tax=Methylovirgula ligni TaxID=569860 RepID=A0A3D9YMR0_9HYPH|nr:hypothetical protein [Methylovirgula ligni]QAY96701.1 hypothetical protein CWB41_13975 [Methylovirgula ligni]REF83258.1 hypothetical protein DES32_3174 [Methylovirgula ligni]
MGVQFSLPAQLPPSVLLPAATDAAGRTSRYADLSNAVKAYLIVEVNQGNAATVTITPLQAKDTSDTGSKAINASPIWLVDDTSTSDAFVAQTPAASFTTDATLKDKLIIFELLPEAALDIANGFKTIAVETGASNAANITRAELVYLANIQALGASQPSTFN